MLGRRGCSRRIFGRGQRARLVGVGPLELDDRLGRPFVERQRAIAVGIELGERLAPGAKDFLGLDLAVLVLVGARKTLLFAALGARFGRLERRAQGPAREARWRRCRQARAVLRARLPQHEGAGDEKETDGRTGQESCHTLLLSGEDSAQTCSASEGPLSTSGQRSAQLVGRRDRQSTKIATEVEGLVPQHIMRRERGKDGQPARRARRTIGWQAGNCLTRFAEQEYAGLDVAAV